MLKAYLNLTKFGIVVFVLMTGLAGFALSYYPLEGFEPITLLIFTAGLYLISSGSSALNQVQEWRIDAKMPRTKERPIPSGKIAPWQGFVLALSFCILGSFFLYLVNPLSCFLGLATIFMYNGLYTLYWKKKWVFGAVPGAIPGAMPVLIGYAANTDQIYTTESFYLFLIMFLWQMPHFWCLAIRFKDDYELGGIPTLPVALGVPRSLYHIGLYTFVYVGLAVASPWFVKTYWGYFIVVLPMAIKVIVEFIKYNKSEGTKGWISFFLWVNFSLLAFVIIPVVDKWLYLFLAH